ncbi:MAG: hypothetical protein J1E37_02720 [Prevotella sp.]|nr:hypothetical protein [Prevotella sp.]
MRRRIPYRVCSCMPSGVITHLEARLLKDLVNREIHPIRCAGSCKRKFMKGMRLGDLCAETGHFWWAMKVWELTESLIADKDWADWRYVCFDNKRVCLSDVVSEAECELLSRRRSDLWRALGFPEHAWWTAEWEHIAANTNGSYYYDLWADKYNAYPALWFVEHENEMKEIRAWQETEQLFLQP